MLRLILAVALVAACLAFPAPKGPSPDFQRAFQSFGGMQPGGMQPGMQPGMPGMFGAPGFQGFNEMPHQKRDRGYHYYGNAAGYNNNDGSFGGNRFKGELTNFFKPENE